MPIVAEVSAPLEEGLRELHETLLAGWSVRGRRRARLKTVLAHALQFGTWDSLAGRQGLSDEETAAAMASLVRHAAESDLPARSRP